MAKKYIYSDINEKYIKDGQGDLKLSLNGEAVKTSLANILLTAKGSRTMLPDFGASLQDIVFENFNQDIANQISQRVKQEVLKWDDRINLISMEFNPDTDSNKMMVTCLFTVKGDDNVMDLTIPVTRS